MLHNIHFLPKTYLLENKTNKNSTLILGMDHGIELQLTSYNQTYFLNKIDMLCITGTERQSIDYLTCTPQEYDQKEAHLQV